MKTTIELTANHHQLWDVRVRVKVADHALVDFTSIDISGDGDEVRARFTKCIPDYEKFAKLKVVAILQELIA